MRVRSLRQLLLALPVAAALGMGLSHTGGMAPPAVQAQGVDSRAQQTTTDPLTIIRQAFSFMYGSYFEPISSDVLLADAWDGVRKAIAAVGGTPGGPLRLTGNANTDWATFVAAFRAAAGSSSTAALDLAFAAIDHMTSARDNCHTGFRSSDRVQGFNGAITHQPAPYTGLVSDYDSNLVYRVYPGSPAEQAGIRPGDTLLPAAGESVRDFRIRVALTPLNSPVDVAIRRPGVAQPLTVTLVPRLAVRPFITTSVLPGGIGVIQWDFFTEGAGQTAAIRAALQDFEAQGVVGWVLDLRTSPGGDAHTMTAIASLFVPSGVIATEIDRFGAEQVDQADGVSLFPTQRPLAVLIDHYSASAADILPGALQDDGRAYLVGETSNGCIGGAVSPSLADGSQLQLQVERILIGNDRWDLDGIGVTPNETVVRTPEILASGNDPQMGRAVQYLLNAAGR